MFHSTFFLSPGWTISRTGRPMRSLGRATPTSAAAGFAKTIAPFRWIRIASGERLDQVSVLRLDLGEFAAQPRLPGYVVNHGDLAEQRAVRGMNGSSVPLDDQRAAGYGGAGESGPARAPPA